MTETKLFDGDNDLFSVIKRAPDERFRLPATFKVPTEPNTPGASVPPLTFRSPPTEPTTSVPLLTVVAPV